MKLVERKIATLHGQDAIIRISFPKRVHNEWQCSVVLTHPTGGKKHELTSSDVLDLLEQAMLVVRIEHSNFIRRLWRGSDNAAAARVFFGMIAEGNSTV